jgi:archaeal type IV pilus assembly protein PilA
MVSKKLFKNKVAVSPVVGTLLMLAITVILAAIYSSTAFNQEPAQVAPKGSIEILANATATDTVPASVKLIHLGGDQVRFGDSNITQVKASLNGGESVPVNATCLGDMSIGDTKILPLADSNGNNVFGTGPVSGVTVNIKIIDVKTRQLITNTDVKF